MGTGGLLVPLPLSAGRPRPLLRPALGGVSEGNKGHRSVPFSSSSTLASLPGVSEATTHSLFLSPEPSPETKYLEGKIGEGLVVWHLDEEISGCFLSWAPGQSPSPPPLS